MQSIRASSAAANRATLTNLSSPAVRAIVIGGAAVGVLDAVDGVVYFGLTAGNNPIEVLQYIASGALGPGAFSGGLATAGIGALIHFGLAYGFTTAFVIAWTRIAAVRRNWAVYGLGWGATVWLFMNLVALPLSRVAPSPITVLSAIHGLIGHALFVGLTAAFVAKRVLGARDPVPAHTADRL